MHSMRTGHTNKAENISVGKRLSIVLMLFCLTLLTSINYLLYPAEVTTTVVGSEERDTKGIDFPPSGTPEEKSSNTGLSIVEEIIHDKHAEIDFRASNQFYLHHIAEADKIEMFHPERISPPPKQLS